MCIAGFRLICTGRGSCRALVRAYRCARYGSCAWGRGALSLCAGVKCRAASAQALSGRSVLSRVLPKRLGAALSWKRGWCCISGLCGTYARAGPGVPIL